MFKKFGVPTLVLGTALTLLSPFTALARHHDRDDEARESIRHEQREHQRHFRGGYFYYGPSYTYDPFYDTGGYFDRWGRWHPYARGYYDAWGFWHPYGW